MKTIGLQIEGNEIILVVLKKQGDGSIIQTDDCIRCKVDDHNDSIQIQQFNDQVNSTFDSIKATKIGIRARNGKAKGTRSPSPISFKLEGIIQLYKNTEIVFIWPQTITAFKRKHQIPDSKHKYQQEAFDVAYYLLNQN